MCPQRKTLWTRKQIHMARRAVLAPLLRAQGFHLVDAGADNYTIRELPDIIIKHNFWRSVDGFRAGNAIDFLIFVLGNSFNDAMEAILHEDAAAITARQKHGFLDRNHDQIAARRSKTLQA